MKSNANDPFCAWPTVYALCFWIGVLTIGPSARASDDESDIVAEPPAEAYEEPPSFLAPMPAIEFDAAVYQPAAEEQREIAFLIEQLTEIDKPDFGIASWMSTSQFAPVKSSGEFHAGIIMIDYGLETSEPLERLVELGPKAIPALWDQDTRMMTEITRVPTWAWRSAWGRYACNQLNNRLLFWDLKARKPIDLPLPEGAEVSDLLCDGDQSALVVATAEGPMYVIDLATVAPIARLSPPKTTGRVSLRLSSDDRLLFWKADLTQYERGSCEPSDEGTVLAVFDVGDLLR